MDYVLLKMEEIDKRFPGVQALLNAQFILRSGEVHALVGENGAGKSTLMKILTGVYQKDKGQVMLNGKKVEILNPKMAQQLGISMVHQELNLMPDLSVAQNIFIGREPRHTFNLFVNESEINKKATKLLQNMEIDLDPKAMVSDLSVAKQQMVEIAKSFSYDAKILIMDEPTAALSETEAKILFKLISQLRDMGVGIVYISHRMEELKQISDRVTVMRDGCYIGTFDTPAISIEQVISLMVGRDLYVSAKPQHNGAKEEKVLEVKNLNRHRAFRDVSFDLYKGEILGFAGLMGAGRTEVARAIFGADSIDAGEIYIREKRVKIYEPTDAVKNGICYLSEDRKRFGLMLDMDVKDNLTMASFKSFMSYYGLMNDSKIADACKSIIETLNIKTYSLNQEVKFLSGGNQQKVVIGKWLMRNSDILIFDEPTRGIDVGAKGEIYKILQLLAKEGKSIIIISSELPEILRICNRIVVMCGGRITAQIENNNITQEMLMYYATKYD